MVLKVLLPLLTIKMVQIPFLHRPFSPGALFWDQHRGFFIHPIAFNVGLFRLGKTDRQASMLSP